MRYRVSAAASLSLLFTCGSAWAQASWTTARPLRTPRYRHTTTALPDGRVLVAGGNNVTNSATTDVEIYDVTRNLWVAGAPLSVPRSDHTATVLPQGRVLVTGGWGWDTAEEYDIATGTWVEAGTMSADRRQHTATLLDDGRVLVAGGQGGGSGTSEFYDGSTRTWAPGPPLLATRFNHTAVLRADGSVLVCGGQAPGTFETLDTCEIFDPANGGAWVPGPTLPEPLTGHTATLLDSGAVLVAGGTPAGLGTATYRLVGNAWQPAGNLSFGRTRHSATLMKDGRVLVTGGTGAFPSLESAELYDPTSNGWSSGPDLAEGRYEHTATILPDGRVLVVGGWASGAIGGPRGSAEMSWSLSAMGLVATTAMPSAVFGHRATLLADGRVLAAGGANESGVAYLFHPAIRAWTTTDTMSVPRRFHTLTLLPNGDVLAAGGTSDGTPSADVYRTQSLTWDATPAMLREVRFHSATLLADGRVLLVGGQSSLLAVGNVQVFDPDADTWSTGPSLVQPRQRHAAILLDDGTVLVSGGVEGTLGQLTSVEIYDPVSNAWRTGAPMYEPRSNHTLTRLHDGRVLAVGGRGTSSHLTSSEIYDPATGAWASGPPLLVGRSDHTATLLPDGAVMVVGGETATGPTSSIEYYDPLTNTWALGSGLVMARSLHTATLLLTEELLVAGGLGPTNSAPVMAPIKPMRTRPQILSVSGVLSPGTTFSVTGTGMAGGSEGGAGGVRNSPANFPTVRTQSVEGGVVWNAPWLPRTGFTFGSMTLDFDPPGLDRGWHVVTVVRAGVPSLPVMVSAGCAIAIRNQPTDAEVAPGASATFAVTAAGARRYQWQACDTGACPDVDWVDLPGATAPIYATGPVAPQDSGRQYRARVYGSCAPAPPQSCASRPKGCVTSVPARLTVQDTQAPSAAVLSPSGGEYWQLGSDQLATWSMSDDVRICRVEARLVASVDGGVSYSAVPAAVNLDPVHPDGTAVFGVGGTCTLAQQVTTTNVAYAVPSVPPSGQSGSLYKVEVTITDHAGLTTTVRSPNPFYIVQSNPDSVRTLILHDVSRMGLDAAGEAALRSKLTELSNHPRVQGFVVDLGADTSVTDLLAAWDADPANATLANRVLVGCHSPCAPERDGIHDRVRQLLSIYTGVKYLVLVGDDRVIPFARVSDDTVLLRESSYAPSPDLTASSTVGAALAQDIFLSDDVLGVMDEVTDASLSGVLFIPDLAVARLVETAEEITTTIATFISQDGVLDVSALGPSGNKVLVTGYDFLSDSARRSAEKWLGVFPTAEGATAPVDRELVGGNWGGSVSARQAELLAHLGGNGGSRYGVVNVNGHANHYGEGVPGEDPFDIQGLGADEIATLNLAGGVVYAVGCHAGLPVPGSDIGDSDHSLDLPQTFLSRGVVSYVANTGYGWGLRHGVGYSERLVEILTEELTRGGTVVAGDAVKRTKLRYYLETPRYDAYDQKSLMQWTHYGLPMYAIKTGIPTGGPEMVAGPPRAPVAGTESETIGAVQVQRQMAGEAEGSPFEAPASPLPSYLTQLTLHFDFTAPGVYTKRSADGTTITAGTPGCPETAVDGCYYTLNGLVERSTGAGDLPIQPYFIYDSRLSGTSQHGVLWKGGTYDQETGWRPVIGELISNAGGGEDHGSTPRTTMIDPIAPRVVGGQDSETCRPSDLEVNSLVVSAGEAVRDQAAPSAPYSIQRTYRDIDLEVFYFNNTQGGAGNCDRTGPDLSGGFVGGAYHEVTEAGIEWAVLAEDSDDPGQVWRVVVVSTTRTATAGTGTWTPLELEKDGEGVWRGSRAVESGTAITYVIQGVDRRGNVSWVDYVTSPSGMPSSGVPHGIPQTFEVDPDPQIPRADFDGDGKSDVAVFQPATGTWRVIHSGTGQTVTTKGGRPNSVPAVGDFDGDGRADHAAYRVSDGIWTIRMSGNGAQMTRRLGGPGYVPATSDFDGDGITDLAVFHSTRGSWLVLNSTSGLITSGKVGPGGATAQPGDYDGDGKADLAVFRATTGTWTIRRSSDGGTTLGTLGTNGDLPVARDYDGDSKTDLAVYRPSTSTWIVLSSSTGLTTSTSFGNVGDQFVPNDYDGDGKADLASYNPTTGLWTIQSSDTGGTVTQTLGAGGGFVAVN